MKKPKLRFRGYTEEWEEKKLGEVAKYRTEKVSMDKQNPHYVSTENMLKDFGGIIFPNYTQDGRVTEYKKYDVLVSNIRPYLNKVWLSDREGGASADVNVFKAKDNINYFFLYQILANERFINYVMQTTTGTKMPRGNKKQIMLYNFSLPSLPEQEKIGSFLSKIDERIELEEKKLELFKERKRGWMQKIFSQEIRFKDEDGDDYPDWEKKRVLQFGEIITGNTPSKKQQEYYSDINGYPWITPTDITGRKNIDRSNLFLTDEGYDKARALPKNTLLVTCIASIGKNAVLTTQGSCNQQINAIIPNDSHNIDFLYYVMEFNKKFIEMNAGQTATKIINKNDFSTLEFKVASLPEQEKIADFLSKQDELISAQEEKVSLLKNQKKGLLQQMFV